MKKTNLIKAQKFLKKYQTSSEKDWMVIHEEIICIIMQSYADQEVELEKARLNALRIDEMNAHQAEQQDINKIGVFLRQNNLIKGGEQ